MEERLNPQEAKRQRMSLGVVQYKFAKAAHVDRSKYCLFEKGHAQLTPAETRRVKVLLRRLIEQRAAEITKMAGETQVVIDPV